tara:strand:+ start:1037 stop:1942 length:906 start_codon:yes stop_codon:yes gene_type:complete
MVGGALVRRFENEPDVELLLRTRSELDLVDQSAVNSFFAREKPDVAVIAAGKVGGIHANNTYPAEFGYENLMMATNAIHAAHQAGVGRLLYLGSSCIYPKLAPQPLHEESLLTGPLEPTNEAYAIAKIAGLKLAEYYRRQYGDCFHSGMPTNLYGSGDKYHGANSHVLPALIRRFHEAKLAGDAQVMAWGTGSPMREFLHVDDLADACAFLLKLENPPDLINIGTGQEISIRELTKKVAVIVGYTGEITWDTAKPDGTPRKLMDVSRLATRGWKASTQLDDGLKQTYASFLAETEAGTLRT